MNSLDTIAGFVVGAFLMTVAVKGKTNDMFILMKRDKGFIKWAIAVGVLSYLYSIKSLKDSVGLIIAMAFIGLFLMNSDTITKGVDSLWSSLGE